MFSQCASGTLSLTFQVIMWSTALQLTLGLGLGWLLARRQFIGKSVLDMIISAPLIFPPIVIGYGLLLLLGRNGFLFSSWPVAIKPEIVFSTPGLVIAAFVAGLPLMVKSVQTSFLSVPKEVREVAANLGARPMAVFCYIDVPIARSGVAAGVILSLGRALGEVGISLMLGGNIAGRTETLSLAIYNSVLDGDFDCANYLSLILVGFSSIAFFVLKRFGKI